MTDELMDLRLRAAGERWRAEHPDAADLALGTVLAEPVDIAAPRPRRRRAPWALLASAAALVAALAIGLVIVGRGGRDTPTPTGTVALERTVWRLAGFGNESAQAGLSTLVFRDGTVVADDSCLVLTARARVRGTTIEFSGLVVRDKGCTDAVGDGPQFDPGRSLFQSTTTWTVDGRRLTLTRGSTRAHLVASTLPSPSPDVPTLTATDWRLVSATDAKGTQHLLDSDAGAGLRIDGSRLQAGDTCNSLSGTVSVVGPTITVRNVGQTEIGCPSSPVPAIVDQVLSGTVQTSTSLATLTLTRAGAGRLVYVWDPASTDTSALTGRTWTPVLIAGDASTLRASLRFDAQNARLTGTDGCTALNAVARVNPGTVTITGVPKPTSTCPAQTTTLDSFLTQSPLLWRIDARHLVLYGSGAQAFSIVLSSATPPAPDAVLDGTWRLTAIEDANAAQSVSERATLTVASGQVTVRASCLLRHGTTTATRVNIATANADPKYCVSSLESVLVGSFRWTVTHGQLHLTKGTSGLVFERA